MPCNRFEEGHQKCRGDRSQNSDVASGLCETRDLVLGQVAIVDMDTLEGTSWDDDLDGLVRTHKVDQTGDRGMGEQGQWRGAGYGCGVKFEPFQCWGAFQEAGYVSIK